MQTHLMDYQMGMSLLFLWNIIITLMLTPEKF